MSNLLHLTVAVFIVLIAKSSLLMGEQAATSCLQRQEYVNNLTCPETEREERFYFDNTTNTCIPILTCPNDTSSLHSSLGECRSACGIGCPKLYSTNAVIVYSTKCTNPGTCVAYYGCKPGYIYFTGIKRTCTNGVWSPQPICAKIELYHKGRRLQGNHPILQLNENSVETVQCRLVPHIPEHTTLTWAHSSSGAKVNGTWAVDGSAYQLTVAANDDGSFPREYQCTATKELNELSKISLRAQVRFEVTSGEPAIILHSDVKYDPSKTQIKGDCICRGLPKPVVSWYVNGSEYINEADIVNMELNLEYVVSELRVSDPTADKHNGEYQCRCSNPGATISSKTYSIQVPEQAVSRRRRATGAKATADTSLCNMIRDETSVTITGQVKRYLATNRLLHVKILRQLQLDSSHPTQPETVLRVQAEEGEQVLRNKSYLMVLKVARNGQYRLLRHLPYSDELVHSLKKQCSL